MDKITCDRSGNSLFASSYIKDNMDIYGGVIGSAGLLSPLLPSASRWDEETEKLYKLWSDTPGEPHELTKYVQMLIRKPSDDPDREELSHQQGWEANILDEEELFHSFSHNWASPWSSQAQIKILKYLESNTKTQSDLSVQSCEEFHDKYALMENDFKDQFPQQPFGPNTIPQWTVGDLENKINQLNSDPAFSKSLYETAERVSACSDVHDSHWVQHDKAAQNVWPSQRNQYSRPSPAIERRDPGEWNCLSDVPKLQREDGRRASTIEGNGRVRNKFMGDNCGEYFSQPAPANTSLNNLTPNVNASLRHNTFGQMERQVQPRMQKENVSNKMSPSVRGPALITPPTIAHLKKDEQRQFPRLNSQQSDLLRSTVTRPAADQDFMSHAAYESWRYPVVQKSKSLHHSSTCPHLEQVVLPNGTVISRHREVSVGEAQEEQWSFNELIFHWLNECRAQCKSLEEERLKTEDVLDKTFGKTLRGDKSIPPYPLEEPGVYQLMANQIWEQALVASLLERMNALCTTPLIKNIYTNLNNHQTTICIIQARIKEALDEAAGAEYKDPILLMNSLKDLARTTRKLRTTLWCALQMTLPKPVNMEEDHESFKEHAENMSVGYSFNI